MAEFPTLAEFLYLHQDRATSNLDTGNEECRCGRQGSTPWREHVQDEWHKARTIETVEQLDALPEMSVVGLDIDGNRFPIVKDEAWFGPMCITAFDRADLVAALHLGPARLLWHPEVDRG
ncbi:hypothetical protein I5J50_gp67 [Mycobacterium phage Purky]|uniref:Uncharacterized protein n=1 Tax=Mycobacterium phage Purky TaxID=2593351 RepID=A0A514TWU8_9CAUD|nr:hypothetical protein I5J50_gp67 [Mycobacterium phage Purky]QDK01170.1 hypothetical protein SEA_PURKY_67 [Mycobacterium phage Purky]